MPRPLKSAHSSPPSSIHLSDATVFLPGNVPADVGAKVTVKVVLCPAVNVTGVVIPETVNPVPDAATAEIGALEPPELYPFIRRDGVPSGERARGCWSEGHREGCALSRRQCHGRGDSGNSEP